MRETTTPRPMTCTHDPSCADAAGMIHLNQTETRRIVHDLRGHAAAIVMNAEAVLQDAPLVDEDRQALEDVVLSARALIDVAHQQLSGRFDAKLDGCVPVDTATSNYTRTGPPATHAPVGEGLLGLTLARSTDPDGVGAESATTGQAGSEIHVLDGSVPSPLTGVDKPALLLRSLTGTVLIADDDEALLHVYGRWLSGCGHDVLLATTGEAAFAEVVEGRIDVLLTDLHLPDIDGLTLAGRAHAVDPDISALLVTAAPELHSAMRAFDHGLQCYLSKPVSRDELCERVFSAVRAGHLRRMRRRLTGGGDDASLTVHPAHFDAALSTLHMAWQPIVRSADNHAVAAEALVRSTTIGLETPDKLLPAADQAGKLRELGRRIRGLVAADIPLLPPGMRAFVNLHPVDLFDPQLIDPGSPLSAFARRVTLEVTERRELPTSGHVKATIASLRALGFQVAIDDLGAGYASLNVLTLVEPDVVKLDMALVRGIDANPARERLLRALVSGCADMGIATVGEGVETEAEATTLRRMGCTFLQGYHFGRPGRPQRVNTI